MSSWRSAGVQCEVNEDDCAPQPGSSEPRCLNGGQCVDGVGRYTCSCPPGFVGEHCEGDVNECRSAPCHGPGTLDCVELVNDYRCLCRLGYTGTSSANQSLSGLWEGFLILWSFRSSL